MPSNVYVRSAAAIMYEVEGDVRVCFDDMCFVCSYDNTATPCAQCQLHRLH